MSNCVTALEGVVSFMLPKEACFISENISSRFSSNSEAFASELLENLDEMLLIACSNINHPERTNPKLTLAPVAPLADISFAGTPFPPAVATMERLSL